MNRLTDESYWDSVHGKPATVAQPSPLPTFRKWLRHIGRCYATEHFWTHCIGRHLTSGPLRVIEIGSAPGNFLKECHSRFGYEPYGVEYSPVGVKVNRENFESWGLDPNHIIQADLFADAFQSAHREQFDVVFSRGFIEHFNVLKPVIDAHINLLKAEGTLLISIPNLSGINYIVGMFTCRELYQFHNLELMAIEEFRSHFARSDLETLFCGYQGGIDLGIIDAGPHTTLRNCVRWVNRCVQLGLNIVFNYFFFGHVPETRYTSPYLVYIGRKKAG